VTETESTTNGISRLIKNKMMWVGIAISFLLHVSQWSHFWLPDVIVSPYRPMFDISNITHYTSLPWCFLAVILDSPFIGLALLMPEVIALSAFVFLFVNYSVLTALFYQIGWMTQTPFQCVSSAYICIWQQYPANIGGVLGYHWWGWQLGVAIGIIVWAFWRSRRYIATSFKGIFRRLPDEKDEPISFAGMWGMFIIGFIGWIAFLIIAQGELISSIVSVIVSLIYVFLSAYIGATTGGEFGLYSDNSFYGPWTDITLQQWGFRGEPGGPTAIWAPQISSYIGVGPASGANATYFVLNNLKLGDQTRTRRRDILTSTTLGYIISLVIFMIFYTYFAYTFGLTTGFHEEWGFNDAELRLTPFYIWRIHYEGWSLPRWPHMADVPFWSQKNLMVYATGFIVYIVLSFISLKWPALPLHPAGFAMATFYAQPMYAYLIGYIIKRVARSVGGQSLVEKKIIPLAVGLLIGYGLLTLVGNFGFLVNRRI